jgi:hypothetical protein
MGAEDVRQFSTNGPIAKLLVAVIRRGANFFRVPLHAELFAKGSQYVYVCIKRINLSKVPLLSQ